MRITKGEWLVLGVSTAMATMFLMGAATIDRVTKFYAVQIVGTNTVGSVIVTNNLSSSNATISATLAATTANVESLTATNSITSSNVTVSATLSTTGTALMDSVKATNYFRGGNGTVANPTFSFVGDTNTGVILSSGSALGFVTGGAEAWVINASGTLVPVGTRDIGNGLANPRDVNIDRNFVVGTNSGIAATIDVIVADTTTNRLVFLGGILISNITTFFP